MVRRTMLRDVYAGYVTWGEVRNDEPSGRFPALWDAETYAAVLREREERKKLYHHPRAGPLSRVVLCHRCGGSMGRARMRNRDEYYLRCTRHARKASRPWCDGCHPNYIHEADILQALGEWLGQFTDPAAIEEALSRDTGGDELETEMKHLQAELGELERSRQRLAYALADGTMKPAMYRETDAELQRVQDAATVRVAELHTLLAARPDPEARQRHIMRLLEQGLELREIPPDTVRSALYQAGVRVFCEDGQILFIAFTT